MTADEHEKYTLLTLLATAPLVSKAFSSPEAGVIYFLSGMTSALFLSPDLDLEASRPAKRWGPLNPLIWGIYRLLHAHRGASHSYLYGPLSRLFFLFLPPLGVVLLEGGVTGLGARTKEVLEWLLALPRTELLAGGLGYLVGQWAHLVQDGIPPRRLFR